jgi:hypothetical protein
VLGASVIAVTSAVIAVAGRVRRTSDNLVAPAIGLVLGGAATVLMVTGIGLLGVVSAATDALVPSSATSSTAASVTPTVSTEPLVFPTNQALTADGKALQQIATAINTTYAGGHSSLGSGQHWPTAVKFTSTQVLGADGTVLATVPAGHLFSYTLASGGKSYKFTVTGTNATEIATYDSGTDRFSFTCLSTDTNCVPQK